MFVCIKMLCFYVPVYVVWRVSFGYSNNIRIVNPVILPSYNSKLEPTDGDGWQRILEEANVPVA